MGGYDENESYEDKVSFFNRYFYGYHRGRLESYKIYLPRHLRKQDKILSIGSGRAALEALLLEDGYDITCSDMEIIVAYEKTRRLFPKLKYQKLDILRSYADEPHDAIIMLSLIYHFNDHELSEIFHNLSRSLKPGGVLIFDSAGSPDNLLSFLIHDVVLKYENHAKRVYNWFKTSHLDAVIKREFGFRRNDCEIESMASRSGFDMVNQENFGFLIEFQRSFFLRKLIGYLKPLEILLSVIGKTIPYTRMYTFRKDCGNKL